MHKQGPAKSQKPKRQGKRHRWLWVAGAICLFGFVCVEIGQRYLAGEHFKPLLVRAIEKETGLPASIGSIHIHLLPFPHADAEAVVVGQGEFMAKAKRVRVHVDVPSLGRSIIDIPRIDVSGLELTLPATTSAFAASVQAVADASKKNTSPKPPRFHTVVHEINAPQAVIRLTGEEEPFAVCELTLKDILAQTATGVLEGQVPAWGEAAAIQVQAQMERHPGGPPTASGTVTVSRVEVPLLLGNPKAPRVELEMKADIAEATESRVAAALSGNVAPSAGADASVQALAGAFSANAGWQDKAFIVNGLKWDAPGAHLQADFTRYAGGAMGCRVAEAHLNAAGLEPLLAMAARESVRLVPQADAVADVRDLLVASQEDGSPPHLASGSATFQGIDLVLKDGAKAVEGVHGDLAVQDGAFTLKEVGGPGVVVRGAVVPDFQSGAVQVDLSADAELSHERLALFLDPGPVTGISGHLNVQTLKATYQPGQQGLPADLRVEGQIAKGDVSLASESYKDELKNIQLSFTADAGQVQAKGNWTSGQLGPVQASGRYDIAAHTGQGVLDADVSGLQLPLESSSPGGRVAHALLAAYGRAPMGIAVRVPNAQEPELGIELSREAAPALSGKLRFRRDAPGMRLAALHAEGAVPVSVLVPVAPESAQFQGSAPVVVDMDAAAAHFTAKADFAPCTLAIGGTLRKAEGVPLEAAIEGGAPGNPWQPAALTVSLAGQAVQSRFEQGRLVADHINVDAAALAPFVVSEAPVSATGRITGSFSTSPVDLALDLHDIAFLYGGGQEQQDVPPRARIDAVNGRVAFQDGRWALGQLAVRAAGSDCVVDGSGQGAEWSAKVSGKLLNVDAVADLVASFRPRGGSEGAAAETPAKTASYHGTADIELAEVRYRRGVFSDVRAHVDITPKAIHVGDLSARPYQGLITGTADVTRGKPDWYALDLQLDQIESRVIDEIAFLEPRDFHGILSGKVQAAFPIGPGVVPENQMSGSAVFQGEKGSFGKLGIATKLLTVLRTTEIVRLRAPSLRDKGLEYDTCKGVFAMKDGVLTIQEMVAQNPTLYLSAAGALDFPRAQSKVDIQVALLGTVTGIINAVGLKGAAEDIRNASSLQFVATGPPSDMKVSLVAGGLAGNMASEVTGKTIQTIDGLKGAAGDVLRGVLGR